MRRSDHPAIRDALIYCGAMIFFAGAGVALWPGWGSLPFWLAYGVLYGSASDLRWHECGLGTAFRTRWINHVVYQIACFMIVRNPVAWCWSHVRHHTDTLIVGRDPGIALMRPVRVARALLQFVRILDFYHEIKQMLMNASGRLDTQEAT